MGWDWQSTKSMRILMGDGYTTETQGVCHGIEIEVDGENFKVDAVLFDLKDIDMILGMTWLASLGEMMVDWGKQTMRISTNQGTKMLKRVNCEESLAASLQGMIGENVEMQDTRLSEKQCGELEVVLKSFEDVFAEPRGLTGYYRKFIRNYGKIAKPLTELTKKEGFMWNERAQQAFEELKQKITTAPILALPNFDKEFELECDASGNLLAKLLGYNFKIIYKPGLENKGADALSRSFEEGELKTMVSMPIWLDCQNVVGEVHKDEKWKKVIADLQQAREAHPGFTYQHGILFFKNKMVIPAKSPWIPKLLDEFHSTPQGGHSGFLRTYRRVAANLYWQGMKTDIMKYVQSCDICQRQKYTTAVPGGLLQPLVIPERIWEDISLDFITGLPRSKGFEAILVVVDRLSKYSHFVALKHPYTTKTIAEVFVKEVVRLHGVPNSVISDRDPLFMSLFRKEFFKMQGTKLLMSTAYHPQTDGQTEVTNRCLETYLRCFITDQPKGWALWLPWAEYWFNTTYHVSTGITPFEAVYGRTPPMLVRGTQGEIRVESVQREINERDEALRQLKKHLIRAQDRMKTQADKHRQERSFEEGDMVFLKLKQHRQHSVAARISPKLSARYYGPFEVLERIGAVAYRLKLPPESRIHPVFHVSLLKKAIGDYKLETNIPSALEDERAELLEPETVLASRSLLKGRERTNQWLVKWRDKAVEEASWEDELTLRSQFPELSLKDKTNFIGGSNDKAQGHHGSLEPLAHEEKRGPKPWIVYERRKKKNADKA
uniref:Retrotransposable element Tf2 n=1 Tax=Cajanus cajan TaxID=3821 RepID=A0A151R791_CAJCA|nr:Retrotransposable element Tf2 [Cajanus cajan]